MRLAPLAPFLVLLVACGTSDESVSDGGDATGGAPPATGGSGGATVATGGAPPATGGSGGATVATGGATGGSGGATTGGAGGSGGATGGSGGATAGGAGGAGGSGGSTGGSGGAPGGSTSGGANGSGGTGGTLGGSGGTLGGSGGMLGGSGGATGGSGGVGGSGGATGGSASALAECRGVVAVRSGDGNYVGWRLKATDPPDLAFNVYRGTTVVNGSPITDSTNYLDDGAPVGSTYEVRPVLDGVEQGSSEAVTASSTNYLSIPLDDTGTNQAGRFAGVGDLDGDCQYEFVLKRSDGDRDVTQSDPFPDETIKIEAYDLDRGFLWRRDLGPNVRPGVWFSPMFVYDLDGDGRAEIAIKASEVGTELGGEGDLNGDGVTDYRDAAGDVSWSEHPDAEFLEVWSGETGEILARAPWIPVGPWGTDGYRYNRNLMSPAYLDGQRASVVITRGGNSRDEVHAYDYANGALTQRWVWVASNGGGNYGHNVRASDIDGDGRDEFLFFNVAIDDDGQSVLWNTQEQHGDRFHLSDIDPDRPGLEVFYVHEFNDSYTHPVDLRDAATGELIWGPTGDWGDVGRGLCANIDDRYRGLECWATGDSPLYDAQGNDRGARPNTPNLAIFWDADRERELISGTTIGKWNGSSVANVTSASGCAVGNRDCPMGVADVLGDWREEAWWLCDSNRELRIYVSTAVTSFRLPTFMQDPEYRTGVGEMMQGYLQSPHPSYYVGSDMDPPPPPRLAIPEGT